MKSINLVLVLPALILITGITANAQKLPNVQKNSVRLPINIKIDGEITGWSNKFQAYNKSTNIYYTIANNDNNLYVIVKTDDNVIIEKILEGGVTFTVENSADNKKAVPVSITSPLISVKDAAHIIHPLRDTSIKIKDALPGMNKELEANSKEIGINGFKGIADSLISVYDNHGIKTFSFFTETGAYIYKLAVPLKYFNNAQKIHYKIRLNGAKNADHNYNIDGEDVGTSTSSPEVMDVMTRLAAHGDPRAISDLGKISPTDFLGTYILAK